jgi:hypothetical protein
VLGYVFWHRPTTDVGRPEYEELLREFHRRLADARLPDVVATASLRVDPLPWWPSGGYEDWYLVRNYAALGLLNALAVRAAQGGAHDAIAQRAGSGTGGLYAAVAGEPVAPATSGWAAWFDKPAGLSAPELAALRPAGVTWQRQMVLGPAPEYRVTSAERPAFEPRLDTLVVPLRPV